jgi:hypothetical protein
MGGDRVTNIYQRINEIQKRLKGVEKASRNTHQNYAYAGHEALNEAIRPLFVEHGIVQTIDCGDPEFHPGGVIAFGLTIRWFCADDPSSYIAGTIPAAQSSTAKTGFVQAQQVGQAISYAVKNFQLKALMLTDSNEPGLDSQDQLQSDKRETPKTSDPGLKERAVAMLAGFGACQTLAQLEAHKSHSVKPEVWATVREYPGIRDQVKAAYLKAKAGLEVVK